MNQIIGILIVLIIVGFTVYYLDSWQAKEFKAINQKIAQDPNYLLSLENRELCNKLLRQTMPRGFFSILEIRKLKKSLDSFKC